MLTLTTAKYKLRLFINADTHDGFCSRGTLQEQSSSVCTNDYMGVIHSRPGAEFPPCKMLHNIKPVKYLGASSRGKLCVLVVQIDPGACSWSKTLRVYRPLYWSEMFRPLNRFSKGTKGEKSGKREREESRREKERRGKRGRVLPSPTQYYFHLWPSLLPSLQLELVQMPVCFCTCSLYCIRFFWNTSEITIKKNTQNVF